MEWYYYAYLSVRLNASMLNNVSEVFHNIGLRIPLQYFVTPLSASSVYSTTSKSPFQHVFAAQLPVLQTLSNHNNLFCSLWIKFQKKLFLALMHLTKKSVTVQMTDTVTFHFQFTTKIKILNRLIIILQHLFFLVQRTCGELAEPQFACKFSPQNRR